MKRLLVVAFVLVSSFQAEETAAKTQPRRTHIKRTTNPTDEELDKIFDDSEKKASEILEMKARIADSNGKDSLAIAAMYETVASVRVAYGYFLKQHPRHVLALMCYGDFFNEIGDEDSALEQWEKARRIDPKNAKAWNNIANVYGHHGPIMKAFRYYEKAIKLAPKESIYYQNLATTVFLFREDAKTYFKADRHNEQKIFDRALSLYLKAIELDPKNLELVQDYASSFDGIKPLRLTEAENAWNRVIALAAELNHQDAIGFALTHLARFKIAAKQFEDARKILDSIQPRADQDPRIGGLKEVLLRDLQNKERLNSTK